MDSGDKSGEKQIPGDRLDLESTPEARERGDSILRRMLKTPPAPHSRSPAAAKQQPSLKKRDDPH